MTSTSTTPSTDAKQTPVENPDSIYGHRCCQTVDSKWLVLENIYQKFHRGNMYDIGGTYINGDPDFWFSYRTQRVGDIFLLHIFASNNINGWFSVGLSSISDLKVSKKNNNVYLSDMVKVTKFHCTERMQCYLTTYSFSALDVEVMKGRKLYIAVTFPKFVEEENALIKHDYGALLNDPVCSDFTIESEDGVKFKVHKTIICNSSDVFKAMLKFESAESKSNCVKLLDASGDDIRAMLEYIYTGTIKDLETVNFSVVLMLADRYNLQGLHDLCAIVLSSQISHDNAIDILMLADLYGSDTLKHSAFKFIKSNREVFQSNAFDEINNVPLLKELCQYISV